jgi:hypothetical protein
MHYNITETEICQDEGYLKVEVSGQRVAGKELLHAKEALANIKKRCEIHSVFKALAIMNLSGEMPFMSAFKLGEKAEQFGWGRGFKIAAVYSDKEAHEVMVFAETVTVNRGYNVGVFNDEAEAVKWLLNQEHPRLFS